MNDIHPNMNPISIPFFTLFDWVFLVVFILFCVGIFGFLYVRFKKAELEKPAKKIVEIPKRMSWKKEFKKLEKLMKKSSWKDFSHSATHLFKLHFSEENKMNLLEKTSEEVLDFLTNHSNHDSVKHFFEMVDPVKFAGKMGEKEKAEEAFRILKFVVELEKK